MKGGVNFDWSKPQWRGTVIKVENFKADRRFGHYDQQKLGEGQKAEYYIRLLRTTETGRGSEGQISQEFHSLGLLL